MKANQPAVQHVPRRSGFLDIYLPLGSEAGRYEIEILRDPNDPHPLARFISTASIRDGLTVIQIDAQFGDIQPGICTLPYRHTHEGWRYCRIAIS